MDTIQQAVIINEKEEILLLQNKQKQWVLPIDFLGENELYETSLKEAVKKCTGLDVDILYQFFSSITKIDNKEYFNVVYLCRPKDKKVKVSEDYIDFKWVKLKEIKKLKGVSQLIIEISEKAILLLSGGGDNEEE